MSEAANKRDRDTKKLLDHAAELPAYEKAAMLAVIEFMDNNPGSDQQLQQAREDGCEDWTDLINYLRSTCPNAEL